MSRILKKWITLSALVLALVWTLDASAHGGNASISGVVTASDGVTPLESIDVTAYDLKITEEGLVLAVVGSSSTQANGSYTISGLNAGNYYIQFRDSGDLYVPEYFDDFTGPNFFESETITLGESSTVTGIDASLALAGKITGTITGPDGVSPATNVQVVANHWDENDEQWDRVATTSSSADGSYAFAGLIPGDYRLEFNDLWGNYLGEYYDNAATLDAAADISVGASSTVSNINASLEAAGKITGTITGPDGVPPLNNIEVSVYRWNEDDGSWDLIPRSSSRTTETGTYTVYGLPPGNFRLQFFDNFGNYESEFYNNAATVESGQDVTVPAATTVSGIDASLAESGRISGTVTAADGVTPLENIQVGVYYWDEDDGNWAWRSTVASTGPDGKYTLLGLGEKTYRLRFLDHSGHYLTEFFNDAASLESAGDIVVTKSASITGINASLSPAGKISGTITSTDGSTALEGIFVEAYRWNGTGQHAERILETSTDEEGHYMIPGLPTGTYRLRFRDDSGNHKGEYYNNAADIQTAADITVTAGSSVNGVDASLAELGKITGKITAADGVTPLANIVVYAYRLRPYLGGWEQVGNAHSSADGRYTLRGLDPGRYRIQFHDVPGNFVSEFHDNASYIEEAEDIEVGQSGTVSQINASLVQAGKITGRITGADGTTPLNFIYADAYRWEESRSEWVFYNRTDTDMEGYYTAGGLPTGVYRLKFHDEEMLYQVEYYNDASTLEDAQDITVSGISSVTGVNASLNKESEPVVKISVSGFRNTGPGEYEMDFRGVDGRLYQLQSSSTLGHWTDVGSPFVAGSETVTLPVSSAESRMFWRVRSVP